MLRAHFVAPMETSTTPAGTRMKVVGQTARPTPTANTPPTSQRQATFTPRRYACSGTIDSGSVQGHSRTLAHAGRTNSDAGLPESSQRFRETKWSENVLLDQAVPRSPPEFDEVRIHRMEGIPCTSCASWRVRATTDRVRVRDAGQRDGSTRSVAADRPSAHPNRP